MALNVSRLAAALKPKIESKIRQYVIDGDATPYPQLTEFAQALSEAIAEEIVSEFQAHAEVQNAQTDANGVVTSMPNGSGTVVGYLEPTDVNGGSIV